MNHHHHKSRSILIAVPIQSALQATVQTQLSSAISAIGSMQGLSAYSSTNFYTYKNTIQTNQSSGKISVISASSTNPSIQGGAPSSSVSYNLAFNDLTQKQISFALNNTSVSPISPILPAAELSVAAYVNSSNNSAELGQQYNAKIRVSSDNNYLLIKLKAV